MKTTASSLNSTTRRLRAHLKAAYAYSELSYAVRLKVGAVLVKDDRIISVGYNGMPSGGSNVCEIQSKVDPTAPLATKPQVVHAEQNVIAFAAKNGIATEGATLVITHSPCFECCKLLIQAGIKHIYYDQEYRDTDPIQFLRDYSITIERIDQWAEPNYHPKSSATIKTGRTFVSRFIRKLTRGLRLTRRKRN